MLTKIRSVMEAFETVSYTCVLDTKACIIRRNERFAALIGEHVPLGESIIPYLKRGGLGRTAVSIWKSLCRNSAHRQELGLGGMSEPARWFDVYITPFHDDKGKLAGLIVVLLDITERKQIEEALAYHAYHDALTGLPNRRRLEEQLQQSMLRADRLGEKFAVLFIDLDGFKQVNDLHGHRMGDLVLVEVANRLQTVLRRDDTISRQGGDEFVILLSGINQAADVASVAEKIIDVLGQPIVVDHCSCQIGASIGIAVYPDHDRRPDRLIQLADRAMYRSKHSGKGRYSFFQDVPAVTQIPIRVGGRVITLPVPEDCHKCLVQAAVDAGLPVSSLSLLART